MILRINNIKQSSKEKKRKEIYGKSAWFYDIYSKLMWFGLNGMFRKFVINELDLKKGDVVLEIGCGTGLNFPRIQKLIGKQGKIIGIDVSNHMLDVARKKVKTGKWNNVVLMQADFSNLSENNINFLKEKRITKVLVVLVAHVIPKYGKVIQLASKLLQSGGKIVIGDLRKLRPTKMIYRVFNTIFEKSSKKFGQDFTREPWKEVNNLIYARILYQYKYTTKLEVFYMVSGTKL
ncbi:MAG: class I SAM-dependent methyltransferase [Candidatus Lokiarchaeota archaeon]|nr:class I SAM-dependent methyltransferase [Candidatus Lokiarchaeota archaeon]